MVIVSCILVIVSEMSIFDFLKRKKAVEKTKDKSFGGNQDKQKKAEKISTTERDRKPGKPAVSEKPKMKRKEGSFSYDVVEKPHLSEKATDLAKKHNKYIFIINKNTNKTEIKKSIEGIYSVDVMSVNIIKIPKKKRRLGRIEGFKKELTKAIVTVKEGQNIEIL